MDRVLMRIGPFTAWWWTGRTGDWEMSALHFGRVSHYYLALGKLTLSIRVKHKECGN